MGTIVEVLVEHSLTQLVGLYFKMQLYVLLKWW